MATFKLKQFAPLEHDGIFGKKSECPGRYWALEIKRDRKQSESKEQAAFIAETRKHSGIAAVVSSFDEAKAALFGERDE